MKNSCWDVYGCLLRFAREYGLRSKIRRDGKDVPAVKFSVSHRKIAEETGLSRGTVISAVKQLRIDGWLRTDNVNRRPNQAGTFLLTLPPAECHDSKQHHSDHSYTVMDRSGCGVVLSPFRRSAPGVLRLGPGAGRVLEILVLKEGRAKKRDIADMMKRRTSNLTRKDGPLCRLKSAGIVHIGDDGYVSLSSDWQERLEEAHGKGLEEEAAEVQRTKHELEREIYNCGADSTEAREALDEYEEARMLFHEAKTLRAEEPD